MGAGFTAVRVEPGFRKRHLAGPLITTDGGRVCAALVGSGFPEMNGRRRGFRGARVTITSAGRPYHRKRDSINAPASTIGPTVTTISVLTNIASFRAENLARNGSRPRLSHPSAM